MGFPLEVEYFNGFSVWPVTYNKQGRHASGWVPVHADPVRVKSRAIEVL